MCFSKLIDACIKNNVTLLSCDSTQILSVNTQNVYACESPNIA